MLYKSVQNLDYIVHDNYSTLGWIDSTVGIMSMTASICETIGDGHETIRIKDLLKSCRYFAVLNYLCCVTVGKSEVDISDEIVMSPERNLLEEPIPGNILGTGFTEKYVFSRLKEEEFIIDFSGKSGRMRKIVKNQANCTPRQFSRKIRKAFMSYTGNAKRIQISESQSNLVLKKVEDLIYHTARLFDVFDRRDILQDVAKKDEHLKQDVQIFQNTLTIPLFGVLRNRDKPADYVIFLLSHNYYDGKQKRIEVLHTELEKFDNAFFSKDNETLDIIREIRHFNSDTVPEYFFRTLLVRPKIEHDIKKQACVYHVLSFSKELIYKSEKDLPFGNLRKQDGSFGWETWFKRGGYTKQV